jgi:hypothetical protein
MTKLKVLMVVVAMLSMQLIAAAPAMAHQHKGGDEIEAGGNINNVAGNGGAGGNCFGIDDQTTVGPAVDCSGGDGGDATISL